jgi:glycosyltransferase involved in cell wall biosynthesis
MKVLHIETGRHLYGGALQVYYLLRGLHAVGIENILVCAPGSEIGRKCAGIATIVELPTIGDIDPRLLIGLCQTIRRQRPDIVHAHSRRGADWWGGIAAQLCGVKSVLTRRVDNPESALLVRLKYNRFDRVVTISEGIRQVLLSEGVAEKHVELIHSVVDLEQYNCQADRPWFEQEFSLHPGERTVAIIAQLIERKGHRFLLAGAEKILAAVPNLRFIFFGQGPQRQELETECRARGLEEKVVFAGFRNDLPRVLPNLDLVVHPALMEGLGVSLLQTAAAGRPMVGARAGGIPEVIREGVNGYLVPPGEVTSLAEKTIELLLDRQLAERFGANGRHLVETEFSIPTMISRYQRLYAQLLR